ncbi:ADP-ribosylation factor family [Pelomyxa schiedti]|nr:ADP-ribosylation factor family [Pelomyxa schiedti]
MSTAGGNNSGSGNVLEYLVLGLPNCGKSSLIKNLLRMTKKQRQKLSDCAPLPTVPTNGVEHTVLTKKIALREIGGSYIQLWPSYLPSAAGIIFVVDGVNNAQLSGSLMLLMTLLTNPELEKKPKAVILNKCDTPHCMSQSQLREIGNFDQVTLESPFSIFATSCLNGEGIECIYSWLQTSKKV